MALPSSSASCQPEALCIPSMERRGLPVERYTRLQTLIAYWGMGAKRTYIREHRKTLP